ncbi:nucleotidyltransferase domain-containing protein [Sporosarcina sp. BI001-red]|uniref:type VII toxin-antitoxin system MntA family adenylyltransferase antitoxin n=1 Tax=Sporosarcina sp. BI001-red TaxID=2282866 RepID=UPI000E2688C5|nr:nucleotidyltransferase domain-containing protein [Sporosarcina sp. BI001-red]REB05164.1 nucleotidyltransferase domain-containing protein [Sporosarcina sp. BI001-red]
MLKEEVKSLLINEIVERMNPAFVVLFGSFAKGTAHAGSDIDLAYFSRKELSSYERFIFTSELAEMTGYEVDLIDIRQIDTVFSMRIFEQGMPIYTQDENEYKLQKMKAYSMYAALSEQRAPIIGSIKNRGSVFGDE